MSSATERRYKRLLAGEQRAIIQGPRELAHVTLAEAQQLANRRLWRDDAPPSLTQTDAGIEVAADGFRYLLAAALGLTTARDVLWILADDVRADTIKNVLKPIETVAWADIIPTGTKPKVRVQATASRIFHEARLTEQIQALLPAGPEEFGLIDVRLLNNRLRLSLSLGGEPLYRRRFKPELIGKASIKEDLAAALTRAALQFAGPQFAPTSVYVPFAGSGTLGFEAALAILGLPPCALAQGRAVERMPCVPPATLAFARQALTAAVQPDARLSIQFAESDADQVTALHAATAAFKTAVRRHQALAPHLDVVAGDALDAWPRSDALFIPVNPPYGHRLADKRTALTLYKRIAAQIDAGREGQVAGFVLGLGDDTLSATRRGLGRWRTEVLSVRHGGLPVWALLFASS